MRKIIDGALYNTETAKKIGTWSNGLSYSNFSHCVESLYLTKSGKYFIHGQGGPNSKYSKSAGNNLWSGGEHIVPMSPQAARDWAEEKLEADEYIALFGEPEEAADGRETLNVTVPAGVKRKLEKMREDTGKSISQIITDAFA